MTQGSLFPTGRASPECSRDALAANKHKHRGYKNEILRLLSGAGYEGHTNHEMASIIGCYPSSLTAAIDSLADDGAICILAEKRANVTGHKACIIVLPEWVDERTVS